MKGISKSRENSCLQRAAVGVMRNGTVLNIIPEKEGRTLRLRFISRFSRKLPVTGDAYAGTLQNRTCFNDETGWLRNYISVPDGADFFMQVTF